MMLIEDVTQNRDSLTVSGPMLTGLAKRRVVVPPLSLPAKLWRYNQGWTEITDPEAIRNALESETIYQSYEKPDKPTQNMYWLDMAELAAVYNWNTASQPGEVWLDLAVAQVRQKYQNFGWDRYTGPAESAYKHFASNNMAAPEDAGRAISGLVCASDLGRGLALPWQGRFDKLDELFTSIGEATEMGWDITADLENHEFVFDVIEGRDLTQGGRIVVISLEMGNAADVERKDILTGTCTTCYAGGAGEDENRMILAQGTEKTGWERREMWAEAGSVDDADMLKLYADKKLASANEKHTLTAQVMDSGACRYGRDWDVGDKVIVRGAGASMAARVISVAETHEKGQRALSVTFGSAPVTAAMAMRNIFGAATR